MLAAVVMHNPEIDCDVLFQYCDLREIYNPIEVFNVAFQYDAVPYRKWSSPLDLGEIGMKDLSLHEKCALQLGWELAGNDATRDRADMSVEELMISARVKPRTVIWSSGSTATWTPTRRNRYCEVFQRAHHRGLRADRVRYRFLQLPEPEESLDDMARAAELALEENKENGLEGEHEEEIPF